MCGIVGCRNLDHVNRALDAMPWRGPDDRDTTEIDGWALGHVRLSIVDLDSRSKQPMTRGSTTVTYNGELWNHLALRTQLEQAGATFTTASDTEVVAWALDLWDPVDALARFEGMFAVGWVRDGVLRVARDRYGEIPLHEGVDASGGYCFASELSAILAAGAAPSTVRWLPPGCLRTVAGRPGPVIRYHEAGAAPEGAETIVEAAPGFRTRLAAACAERAAVSDVTSDKYHDIWDVWERKGFILGHTGAPCTVELKKKMRYDFQRPDDVQMFGLHVGEEDRVAKTIEQEPGIEWRFPLIDRGLDKSDCLAIVHDAGIRLPVMYEQGYPHNNCIGCPKGGMGYWNAIRVDFPDVFVKMSVLERDVNYATHSERVTVDGVTTTVPIFLDELDPNRGDMKAEGAIECSVLCAIAKNEIDAQP